MKILYNYVYLGNSSFEMNETKMLFSPQNTVKHNAKLTMKNSVVGIYITLREKNTHFL